MGTHCLKEAVNTERNKKEDAEREMRQRAVNEKAAKTKVRCSMMNAAILKLCQVNNRFYDDRSKVKERVERERAGNVEATQAIKRQSTMPSEKVVNAIEYRTASSTA